MKQREAFNFYRSYYDVLEDIHRDEDKLTYLMALLDKQFKGIEPSLKGIPKLVYNGQKHSIDKQVEGWENKTKIRLAPSEPPSVPPTEGTSEGSLEPPTEDPLPTPSNDSVMTTEGGYQGPSVQEQEQGKEEEQEKEQVEVKEKFKIEKEDIEHIMSLKGISESEAIIYIQSLIEDKSVQEKKVEDNIFSMNFD